MPRKANPYTRVTEVASFVNSEWKTYWYKSIEKGLLEIVAQEIVTYSKTPQTIEFWKEFLLTRSALKEADRIGRESTDFGKGVHAIVENYLIGTPIEREISDRQKFCGGLIKNWCVEAKVKPLVVGGKPAVEVELISDKYGLTGHPDLLNTFGDDKLPWVTDWKTSKECRIEYILQMAAYAQMVYDQFGIDIQNGAIIRTPSDPNTFPQFETHTFTNLRTKYFPLFLEALDVVQFFKKKGRWREAA